MPTVGYNDPSALYSGSFWTGFAQTPTPTPIVVTFSFPTTLPSQEDFAPVTPGSNTNLFTSASDATFTGFTAAEQAQAIQAMSEWAGASQIVFVQVQAGQGDINFGNVDFSKFSTPWTDGGIGFNPFGNWNSYSQTSSTTGYFTSDLSIAGSVFMNSEYLSDGNNADSTVNYETLLHELGHAIGMKHPTQVDSGPASIYEDNVMASDSTAAQYTVMSQTSDASTGGAAAHLLPTDLLAAAGIYGSPGSGTAGTSTGSGEVITDTISGGVTTFTTSTWDSTTEAPQAGTPLTTVAPTISGSNSVSTWTWDPATQTMTQVAATAN